MEQNNIQMLDDILIDKIAAGEVVERPGSVVKELVENAIDALADTIMIEIREGGISLIQITDNGRGIASDEVLAAFMRHTTSKIRSMEDLENILTLGFRGEALSSIAAVSQIEMITKSARDNAGKVIEIHGGKLISEKSTGTVNGTTLTVRNLFYNTPARRKFLKKPGTESGYITDIVKLLALGHPEISFRYQNNESEVLYTNGSGDLKSTIYSVYGKDIAKSLIQMAEKSQGFGLKGYLCRPHMNRGNRNYGNFFINGRYIKSDLLQSAIEQAYKGKLPIGKFPVYVLHLDLDPRLVDVNVHPTKLEVRFSDEQKIFDFCYEAAVKTLESEFLIPKVSLKEKEEGEIMKDSGNGTAPFGQDALRNNPSAKNYAVNVQDISDILFKREEKTGFPVVVGEAQPMIFKNENTVMPFKDQKDSPVKEKRLFFHHYRIIGQFFTTYWVVEQDTSLYLIDQHAAHERVLYEHYLADFKAKTIQSQRLIEPAIFKLSMTEYEATADHLGLLDEFGFEIELGGHNTLILRGVPFILKGPANESLLLEIVDKLENLSTATKNIYDTKLDTIATMACKAAVKAHDKISYVEAKTLIDQMLQLEEPFTCPHGRPTIVEITKYEIEKMFKRIQ